MSYLEVGLRALIATVFLVSSVGKLAGRGGFEAFVASLGELNILPVGTERAVARTVVIAEVAVWVLLAIPAGTAAVVGFGLAAALLTAFTAGIVRSLATGARGSCHCFGPSSRPLGPPQVIRNAALLAASAGGLLTVPAAAPTDAAGLPAALIIGLVLGGLVTVLEDVVDLFRPIRPPGRDVTAQTREQGEERDDSGVGARRGAERAESAAAGGCGQTVAGAHRPVDRAEQPSAGPEQGRGRRRVHDRDRGR